jgi:RNA polymerase sigma-70 factor (ECF subfamily)
VTGEATPTQGPEVRTDAREAAAAAPRPMPPPRPAFRAVFDGEFDYVWSTLRRMGVRERDLEDLTHDTFLKVSQRLGDYDTARPLRPWLFAFAFRVAADYRRLARHRVEALGDVPDNPDPEPAPDEQLATSEGRALIATALQAIELERRAVFVLHVLDDCAIPEVAVTLGIPLNTAYSRLRLAREEFSAAVHRLKLRRGKP